MKGHIMRSFLLIFVFVLVSAQARTLTEDFNKLKGIYGIPKKSSPPAPFSAPPTEQTFSLFFQIFDIYGGHTRPSPPSPKPSDPDHPMITSSREENIFWTLQNYGRTPMLPPPAPKLPPPIHQLSGGGMGAAEAWESPENLFRSA